MKLFNFNEIAYSAFFMLLFLSSNQSVYGQTHIVPISASTTAGEFGGGTAIENIYDEATPASNPLTDPLINICSVADPMAYISAFGVTAGTLTVGIPPSGIDALHVWNGWSTACELNHSLNSITLEFFSGGASVGTETVTVPIPDGSGFGFVIPFASSYADIDEVTILVNSLHGGNEIGIIELGFRPIECTALTTSVSSTDICIGDELTLTATSESGIITWDEGAPNGTPFVPGPAGVITYTTTSTSPDDCIFSVDVTIHELPDVTANVDDDEICLGESVVFTGGGATTYVWDMGVTDGDDFEPPLVGTETYTVIGTDEFDCVNTASVDVTVTPNALPDFEFVIGALSSEDGLTGGCVSSEVQFNDLSTIVDPGDIISWDWNFGGDGTSTDENPTHTFSSAGTYTVTLTVETDGGCTAIFELDIIMTEGLTMDIIFNTPTCFGFTDGSVTVNVLGGVGDLTFEITDTDDVLLNEDNSNTANTLGEGWYYINVIDELACTGIDSVYLEEPGELDIEITVIDPLCYGFETGTAEVTAVINYTGADDMISYIWNPNPGGNSGLGENATGSMGAGDYTVTINDENGCSKVFDFTVNEPDELVFAEFGFEHAYCRLHEYQSGNGVVFGAAAGGTPDYTYLWVNLDDPDESINSTWGGLNPGNYELTATDANGCVLKESLFLDSLNPIAAFTVNSAQLNTDCQGTASVEVEFVNASSNYANPNNPSADTTFFWNLDDPVADWQVSHDFFETFDTTYGPKNQTYFVAVCLVVINKNGCTDTACKELTIYKPIEFDNVNIFSPNGDGVNDEFTFEFKSASIAEFNCVIVNRWGIVVHEITDINDGWDGTDRNGDPCTNGVYFYKYVAKTDNFTDILGQGTVQLVE